MTRNKGREMQGPDANWGHCVHGCRLNPRDHQDAQTLIFLYHKNICQNVVQAFMDMRCIRCCNRLRGKHKPMEVN